MIDIGRCIGTASGGAFDIGRGDAVRAWGFGPEWVSAGGIRKAMAAARRPAHELLKADRTTGLVRKLALVGLHLNGIAKGYGVDRLAEMLRSFRITTCLVGIDGEIRTSGAPW